VLEVRPAQIAVVRCFSEPAILDTFVARADAYRCRVAPDELLVVSGVTLRAEISEHLSSFLADAVADALVIDHTDAFSAWTLVGPVRKAFARLSAVPLPSEPCSFLQCPVGLVGGKVIVDGDHLHILVSSAVGHYLPARFWAACADLEPIEGDEFEPAPQTYQGLIH
jgi:hypothetical protein